MEALLIEKQELINERDQLDITDENERRIAVNFINSKLLLLNNRISTAKIIDPNKQPKNVIRFGALVMLKISDETKLQKYQIVGVDEADISTGKISFVSPIARILLDKKVGEMAILKLMKKERVFEVLEIVYN